MRLTPESRKRCSNVSPTIFLELSLPSTRPALTTTSAVMLYAIFLHKTFPSVCCYPEYVVELDILHVSTRTANATASIPNDSPERARERARVSSLMTSRNLKTSSYGKMAAKNRHSREVGPVSPQCLAAATNRNSHQ